MKNFLSKIRKFLARIPKYELGIFLILLSLWLFSLTDNIITVSTRINNGNIEGYIDGKKWGEIKADINKIENLEIDLEHHNLPKPLPFKTEIVNVEFFDSAEKMVYQTNSSTVQLPTSSTATTAEIKLKNCLFAQINFNRQTDSYYSFLYRPFWDKDTDLAFIKNGKYLKEDHRWRSFYLPILTIVKYFLKIIFLPFPYLVIAFIIYSLLRKIKFLKTLNEKIFIKKNLEKQLFLISKLLIPTIFVLMFFYLTWVNVKYVEKIPHDPDSVAYLWGAKYLASGKLWLSQYNNFFPFWNQVNNNHWTIVFPYGHPLILSPGVLLGIPWIIPPLVGTFFLVLMYKILKEIVGRFCSFMTVIALFFSPLFQMHAATFMSHNTAVFYLAITIYSLIKIYGAPRVNSRDIFSTPRRSEIPPKQNSSYRLLRRSSCFGDKSWTSTVLRQWFTAKADKKKAPRWQAFAGGIAFVLLYLTRPLTAVALSPPLGMIIFFLIIKSRKNPAVFWLISGLIFSGLLTLLSNKIIYGHPVTNAYQQINNSRLLWNNSLTLAHGLTDSLSYALVFRLMILPGLPIFFTFIILLSIFHKKLFRITIITSLGLLSLVLLTAVYNEVWGIFLGTRFWYEMIPFAFLLIGISFNLIIEKFKKTGYLFLGIIIFLIATKSINGWILGKEKLWENMLYFTPNNIKELKGFNFSDARLIKEAKRQRLNNALIFVKDCGGQWWCYGTVLNENTINFDGNIVWAQDLGKKNQELINNYPGRKVFIADYYRAAIEPYTVNENGKN